MKDFLPTHYEIAERAYKIIIPTKKCSSRPKICEKFQKINIILTKEKILCTNCVLHIQTFTDFECKFN